MKPQMIAVMSVLLASHLCSLVWPFTDLSDPAESWKQEQVGVTSEVPYPFEPLTVHRAQTQTDVKCWGRTYMLNAPFPVQIVSQGENLLAAPIRLVVKAGGKVTELETQSLDITSEAQDRVEFNATMQVGPVTISVPGSIEYDGLIDIDLTVAAEQPSEIEQLSVQIPISAEVAKYYHLSTQWGKYEYGRIGELPEGGIDNAWQACWWIGDDYRGLSFVTDTWGGWTGPTEKAFNLVQREGDVLLTANIINEPTRIEGQRKYRIGLQATPGKPLPETWHGRHLGQGSVEITPEQARAVLNEEGTNVALMWNNSAKFFSYPEPKDPDAFKQAVQTYHDAGLRCVYYITLSGTGMESGVFQRNYKDWLMTRPDGKSLFGNKSHDVDLATTKVGDWASVCPASSFSDWLVWAVDRIMEDYDLDGVYIDNAGPYYCSNQDHGCNTRGARTHPYFAVRDLHKRLYAVVHGRKPETGIVWEHNSRTSNSLNLTFCDFYSDGEHFRVKSKGRPEQITRTLLDITGTGRQWGSQPCFLASALNLREEYTSWLLARLLPFGNVMFSVPKYMDFSIFNPVLRARLDFGLGKQPVTWFTPEAVPDWFQFTPQELVVGGYLAEDNRALITVSNLSDDKLALRAPTAPIAAKFGGPVVVYDATTGAKCPPLGKNLLVVVPANSFRLIRIERE